MKTWVFCLIVLSCLYCVRAVEYTVTYNDVFKSYGDYTEGDIRLCFEGHMYDSESGLCYAFPNSNNNDPNHPLDFAKMFRVNKPDKTAIRSNQDNWFPGEKFSLNDYKKHIDSAIRNIEYTNQNRVAPLVYDVYPHKKGEVHVLPVP